MKIKVKYFFLLFGAEIFLRLYVLFFTLFLSIFSFSVTGISRTENNGIVKSFHEKFIGNHPEKGQVVEVSYLVDEIRDIDLTKGHFTTTAEMLLKWKPTYDINNHDEDVVLIGDHLHDFLEKNWHPEFVINNEENPRETLYKKLTIFKDGTYQLIEKFNSEITIHTQMLKYPFGNLDLHLDVAAFTHHAGEMILKPVKFEFGHTDNKSDVIKGSWTLVDDYFKSKLKPMLGGGEKLYSNIIFHFVIVHDFMDSVQKIFFPLFLVMIVSMCMNVFCSLQFGANADWRIGGQMTLVLTIVAIKFSLASELPITHGISLVDKLFILATAIASLNLIGSVFINDFFQRKKSYALTIENTFNYVSPIMFSIMIFFTWYTTFMVGTNVPH